MMRRQKGPALRPSASEQPSGWEALRNPGLRHRPEWKRFTIDVPVELHRRIKMACASRDLEMATWMRNLLETNVARLENSPRK
jgi:hypothetical protein